MSTFRICLFGKFCVRYNEQILDGLDARKVQELFCYLLLHRDHSLPRETLASLLWPDSTTVQSKKNLRQALWHLQSALRPPDAVILKSGRAASSASFDLAFPGSPTLLSPILPILP